MRFQKGIVQIRLIWSTIVNAVKAQVIKLVEDARRIILTATLAHFHAVVLNWPDSFLSGFTKFRFNRVWNFWFVAGLYIYANVLFFFFSLRLKNFKSFLKFILSISSRTWILPFHYMGSVWHCHRLYDLCLSTLLLFVLLHLHSLSKK